MPATADLARDDKLVWRQHGFEIVAVPATRLQRGIPCHAVQESVGDLRPLHRLVEYNSHVRLMVAVPKSTVKLSPLLSVIEDPLSHHPSSGSAGEVGVSL